MRSGLVALAGILAVLVSHVASCGSSPPRARPAQPVALSPDAYSHYLRGRIASLEGDHGEAIRRFRAAAIAAPDELPIFVALIEALGRAGHHAEALRTAQSAQTRWPDDVEIWLVSGDVYRRAGALDRAIAAYRRAEAIDEYSEEAYLGLAATYIALAKPHHAEAAYRRLVVRHPASVTGHYRLARRLIGRKAYRQAERHLRQVLAIEPDHVKARVALARVLRALGHKRASISVLRDAFDRSGRDAGVGEQLFRQLLEVGDRAGALALVGELDREDLAADTRLSFGHLYLQLGEVAAAVDLADTVLDRHPVSGGARLLKAHALIEIRELDDAVSLLLEVAPERPAYPECRALAAETLARAGHHRRASQVIERALASRPRDVDLIIAHARVEELAGRARRARAILAAARAARPGHPDLGYALAAFEERQGRPGRALAIMEKILAGDPDNVSALNFVGYSLADRGRDLARAERLLLRAMDRAPGDAFVLDSYGWLLFRQKRFGDARVALERAARLAPREAEILWHLGDLYRALRQRDRALELLTRARSLDPDKRVLDRIEAGIQALRTDESNP